MHTLYTPLIRASAQQPRYGGVMESPDCCREGVNPLCGDKIVLYLKFDRGTISRISHLTRGCILCKASSELMASFLDGRTLEDACQQCGDFMQFLSSSLASQQDGRANKELCTLFAPVRRSRLRTQCVALPWKIGKDALS